MVNWNQHGGKYEKTGLRLVVQAANSDIIHKN